VPSTAPVAPRSIVEEPPAWARAAAGEADRGGGAPRRVFRPAFLSDRAETAADAISTLAGEAGWRWGLGAARSEDPARPRAHDATWLAAATDGGALLDRFGISLAILPATLVGPRGLRALAVRGDWALVAFPAAPAASVMGGARWTGAGTVDEVDRIARGMLFPPAGKLPRGTLVLRGEGPARPDRGPPRPCEIRRWRAGDIELGCAAGDGDHAVVSSTAAAGWSATVDGAPVSWLAADVLRRAVPLSPGEHVIRWTYEAPLGAAGLWCALAGVLALAGLAVGGVTARRGEP
jgi:hypothetical protein